VLNIYDELFKQDKVKHVLVRHEQGAGARGRRATRARPPRSACAS
jgi:thiamine pyrophosphate-dependent acetolactate synthase large subunit-like protein